MVSGRRKSQKVAILRFGAKLVPDFKIQKSNLAGGYLTTSSPLDRT